MVGTGCVALASGPVVTSRRCNETPQVTGWVPGAQQDPPQVSTGSGATRIGNAVAISNYDILGRRAFATLSYRF